MICGSPEFMLGLPLHSLRSMTSLMKKVLTYDPVTIRNYEINQGLVWGTFLPYMTFLYTPSSVDFNRASENSSLIIDLHSCAFDILLHCLENALGRKEHVDILIEEELVDFMVVLTWTFSSDSHKRALNIYKEVSNFHQIQPPSLSSIAKAELAKYKYGLKKMRNMKSISHLFS